MNSRDAREYREELRGAASRARGAERAWAHRNLTLHERGYYTSDELIDHASDVGFTLMDPAARIRRGTRIEAGVVIGDGTVIDGENVSIGADSEVIGAVVSGSDVQFGQGNLVSGVVEVGGCKFGSRNRIKDLVGRSNGHVSFGADNVLTSVRIEVHEGGSIRVGNANQFHAGLNLNVPFPEGSIFIGNHNSLGRDGGGVISSSYRFGRRWNGHVCIGSRVEMTRGAEVLGFSVLGWSEVELAKITAMDERALIETFVDGDLHRVSAVIDSIRSSDPTETGVDNGAGTVSLFGVVKTKRCLLTKSVTVKDGTRVQCAFLRDALIPERCIVSFASVAPRDGHVLRIPMQDLGIWKRSIEAEIDWADLEKSPGESLYPPTDGDFYRDHSWDEREI